MTGRRRTRRTLRTVLALTLVVTGTTSGGPAPAGQRFPDVSDTSALAPAAAWALDQQVLTGYPDGTFRPGQPVTRGQLVTWLWNLEGRPAPAGPNPFTDLRPGSFAHDAAGWASEQGIVGGYADGTFRPGRQATRGQVIGWLWRGAGAPAASAPSTFPDVAPASGLGRALAWAVEHGVAGGFADGRFKPGRTIIRGTTVRWVHRAATLPAEPPPNVLVILTDDQTLSSVDPDVMPNVLERIGAEGTTFTEDISAFPLCCPARATHGTGQYSHNHGVVDNDNEPHPTVPGQGGYDEFDHTNTVATWLDATGYATSFVGKTLNDYNGATAEVPAPPGYDRWFGWILQAKQGTQQYFNYEVYADPDGAAGPTPGTTELYGNTDDDYLTRVLRDQALADLDDFSTGDDPWFLTFAPFAPHSGTGRTRANMNGLASAPDPDDVGHFVGQEELLPDWPLADRPAYDTITPDKPQWVHDARSSAGSPWNQLEQLERDPDQDAAAAYRQYHESLLSVDRAVGELLDALEASGELEDTIVIYTSDNGYQWGEHGFLAEKNVPYEESLRVPLLIRGPGFPAGTVVSSPTADIDYAPTLVRATGATPGLPMDGLALQDVVAHPEGYDDRAVLITNWPTSTRPNSRIRHWEGVRTSRYTYVVSVNGGVELYDRQVDPHQLDSVHADPAYADVLEYLDAIHQRLVGCRGAGCDVRATPPEPNLP